MAKTKQQKAKLIEFYGESIDNSSGILFSNNPGLKVNEVVSLRKKLSTVDAKFHILKNKIFRLAAQDRLGENDKLFNDSTTAIFAKGDVSQAARIYKEFVKGLEVKPTVKGGVLEGKYLAADKASSLADLPSKEELIAKTIYMFNAPLSGLANTLSGNTRTLVYALNALKEQKENK